MSADLTRTGCRRVAVICRRFPPEYGGPGISYSRLAARLGELGIDSIVLCHHLAGTPSVVQEGPLVVRRVGAFRGALAETAFTLGVLSWLVRARREYSVIHGFASGWLSFMVPPLARILRKRASFTMTLLGSDDPEAIRSTWLGWMKLRLFGLYDSLVYINPVQASRVSEVYGPGLPLVRGSVGVNLEHFHPPSLEQRICARGQLGLPEAAVVGSYVGNPSRRKGIDLAIGLWLEVARQHPDAFLVVLGPDNLHGDQAVADFREAAEQVQASGYGDRFRFLWSRPDANMVRRVLHASDVYLLPSRNEGTPTSVLEAMACGIPPVLLPLEGFTGIVVRDGSEGLVLDPSDGFGQWAGQVVDLLQDATLRTAYGVAARAMVQRTHSEEFAVGSLLVAWGLKSIGEIPGEA